MDISSQYETPPPQPSSTSSALKARIKHHYQQASEYYYSLWGEHIHHGYFLHSTDTKEAAQRQLIHLLLLRSQLRTGSAVLDIGCGLGGTARFLAKEHGCEVVGVTISGRQVEMAREISAQAAGVGSATEEAGFVKVGEGGGKVRFEEMDAETIGDELGGSLGEREVDCVWISECMSHLAEKEVFFRDAWALLKKGGKVVVADWFRAEGLGEREVEGDIRPIEDGMLLPPLQTQSDYVRFAEEAGFGIFSEPLDISKEVARTWDISWSLIQSPALWKFAFSQGRDGIAFLQAFRAMRRGYANGTFRYAVMVFQK